MAIERSLRKAIIEFLAVLPALQTEEGRKTALYSAGLDQMIPDLNLRGSPRESITALLEYLENAGKIDEQFALIRFLEDVKSLVGKEGQARLQEFCEQLPNQLPVTPRPSRSKRQRQAENRNRENLLILLQRVQDAWIEGVFKQSLHNEVLIELGKTEEEAAVDALDHPLNLTVPGDEVVNEKPVLSGDIREIYEEAQQTLLILGAPGAGKTMTLLDLTRQLAEDATEDTYQAIPVVFNLSSWTNKRQPIADWLVDELLAKYRIPKKIGRTWVEDAENRPLVFMLDGLDEVAPDLQPACVEAINAFREEYALSGIVVACREKEYSEITTRLKLEQALCVQPLTDDQIADYLVRAGNDLAGLRATLPTDEALQELARSPLMLSMMSLAYQDQSPETIRQDIGGTADARRNSLFATYVQRMFQRPRRGAAYDEQKTCRWLTYLAYNMQQHGQTIFQIENLQPSWLLTKAAFWLYVMLSRLWSGMSVPVGYLLLTLLLGGSVQASLLKIALAFMVSVTILIGLFDGLRLQWMRRRQTPPTNFGWLLLNMFVPGIGIGMIMIPWTTVLERSLDLQEALFVFFVFAIPGSFLGLCGWKQTMFRDVALVENLRWLWKRFGLVLLAGIALGSLHFIWLDRPYLAVYTIQTAHRHIFRRQTQPVHSVTISPDSSMLATTSDSGVLFTREGAKLEYFDDGYLTEVTFSPDNTLLFGRYRNDLNQSKSFRTREGRPLADMTGVLGKVRFSPDSALLFAENSLWTREGREITNFDDYFTEMESSGVSFSRSFSEAEFSPDSALLFVKDFYGNGTLWTREGQMVLTFGKDLGEVLFSPDNTLFFIRYKNGARILWTREGQPVVALDADLRVDWDFDEDDDSMAKFSPDSTLLFIRDSNGTGTLWTREGRAVVELGDDLSAVTFSPDSTLLFIRDSNGKGTVWTREGRAVVEFGNDLSEVVFSPDNSLVFSIDRNGMGTLWTREGQKLSDLGKVTEATFSPDSTLLFTRTSDGKGTLWTREGRKLTTFGSFWKVHFSPDSSYLILFSSQYNYGPFWMVWVMVAFTVGLGVSIRANAVEQTKTRPNEGIWRTLTNSLILGLGIGAFVGGICALIEWWLVFFDIRPLQAFGLGLLFSSFPVMMWFGLLDFLQHFTLRFILWAHGYAPWRYARFLDDATDRIFLRKVGGGYIFVHRLLLEYFAALQHNAAD